MNDKLAGNDGSGNIPLTIREHGSVFGAAYGSTKMDQIRWNLVIKLPKQGYHLLNPITRGILVQSIVLAIESKAVQRMSNQSELGSETNGK